MTGFTIAEVEAMATAAKDRYDRLTMKGRRRAANRAWKVYLRLVDKLALLRKEGDR